MINIIPTPKVCNETEGKRINVIPSIYTEHKGFAELCKAFATDFYKVTYCPMEIEKGGIELKFDPSVREDGYVIDCMEDGIFLMASTTEGMNYALASFLQLFACVRGDIT